jgi:hypothetical protein
MSKHFRVSARLPVKLEELGVRASAVLRRAGLPPELFNQPRALVTTEELFTLRYFELGAVVKIYRVDQGVYALSSGS